MSKIGMCALCGDQLPKSQTTISPILGLEVCAKCDDKGMERIRKAVVRSRKKKPKAMEALEKK